MKRHLIIIVLAVFVPLFASAQQGGRSVSLIPHVSGGYGGFIEGRSDMRPEYYAGSLGADVRFGLSSNWSLLVGLDYQLRFNKSTYTLHSPNYNMTGFTTVYLTGHYFRLPVCAEYNHRWFYLAAGPYLEKGFGDIPVKFDLGTVGVDLEVGGRIAVNRNNHLRIGLLTSYGFSFVNQPIYSSDGELLARLLRMDNMEICWQLRVGYEHRF